MTKHALIIIPRTLYQTVIVSCSTVQVLQMHACTLLNLVSSSNSLKDHLYQSGCLASAWRSMDHSHLRLAESKQDCLLLTDIKVTIYELEINLKLYGCHLRTQNYSRSK